MSEERSEFGRGVVVCLAKFSEHLMGKEREVVELDALRRGQIPRSSLKSGTELRLRFQEDWWCEHPEYRRTANPLEAAISHAIEMWGSGAGDHLLELDTEHSPEPLRQLGDLMVAIRTVHMRPERSVFTMETLKRVRELWCESCLAIDRQLGAEPDWGEW